MKEKHLGDGDFSKIPNGAPGVETRMSLVYDGGVRTGQDLDESLRRADLDVAGEDLRHVPEERHHRARLRRRHRHLRSGEEDDASAKTHHMKVDYNPYEGRQVTGVTETVLSRGKVIIEGGKFTGKAGAGSFLKRDPRQN